MRQVPLPVITDAVINRLIRRIDIRSDAECWPWMGAKSTFGHGRVRVGGKLYSPHRLIYHIACEALPADNDRDYHGPVVMHACDNPACCNPKHLSVGTQKDNAVDMAAKGRARCGPFQRKYEPTEAEVEQIITSKETGNALAARLGLHRHWVNRIRREAGIDTTQFRIGRAA